MRLYSSHQASGGNKSRIKDMFIVLLTFLFIYYPPLISINTLHVLAAISYVYILSKSYLVNAVRNNFRNYGFILFAFFYLGFICIITGNAANALGVFVWLFEVIPITFMLVDMIQKNRGQNKNASIWNYLIAAGILQAVISILAFAVPSFQSIIIQRMLDYGFKDVILKMSGHRMYGFSYTLAFAMPVVQAILAAACIYKAFVKNIIYMVFAPLLLFSSIINARVGIVVFIIALIIALFASAKITLKNIMVLFIICLMISLLPKVFTYFLNGTETFDWIETGMNSITDFIFEKDTSGEYVEYATNAEKYRVPKGLSFFFGTGNISTRGNAHYASDVGFINDMWLGGIFYVVPLLFYFIKRTFQMTKFYYSKSPLRNIAGIITIIMFLLVNIKGRCFSWNEITNLWFLIYTFMITFDLYTQKGSDGCENSKGNGCDSAVQ